MRPMLDAGSDTAWEWFPPRVSSYCHGWSGIPIVSLLKHVLKLEIPVVRDFQYKMLVSLDRLNVQRLSLFPGIDGFAQSMQLSPIWWHPDSYRMSGQRR